MKILKTGLTVLLGGFIYSQTPVTDAKANVALELNGVTLRKLVSQNQQLVNLIQKNNQVLDRVRDMSEEELQSKKNAPNQLLVFNQMAQLEEAKNKLVRKGRQLIDLSNNFKHLKEDDYEDFFTETTSIVKNSISLWKQVEQLMKISSAIIPAKERQETLENATEQIIENSKRIEKFAMELSIVNKEKGINNVLFGF